jgi:hypothetical protein
MTSKRNEKLRDETVLPLKELDSFVSGALWGVDATGDELRIVTTATSIIHLRFGLPLLDVGFSITVGRNGHLLRNGHSTSHGV